MSQSAEADATNINFTVAEWTDESVPALLDLTRATLGTGGAVAKTEEFWAWKHQANPFGRSYGNMALDPSVADAEGCPRVVSLRVLLRWRFRSPDGAIVPAARAVDTATHRAYQRRGLFSRLTQRAIADLTVDGTRLIYNTPNAKSLPGYLKMGWRMVDKRSLLMRPLRPLRMAWRMARRTPQGVTAASSAFFDEGVILPWAAFIERHGAAAFALAEEWERLRPCTGLRTERSQAYYAWRYGLHPNVTYFVCPLWQAGQVEDSLAGFAVVRPNLRFGAQEVVLCEMALAEPSPQLGRELARSLARHSRADYIVAHFAAGSVERRSLRAAGFRRVPRQGMTFTVRPLAEMPLDPCSPEAWDLTLGDLEVF